jgi:hypothetical protein
VNLSSGGLAILVVGALWFLVLLPSFINNDRIKPEDERPEVSIRETVEAKLGVKATKALKAKRARNFAGATAVIALLIAGLSWAEFAATANSLIVAILASVSAIALSGLAVRSHRQFAHLSEGSVKRDLPITLTNTKIAEESQDSKVNAWKPDEVPNQKFLRTGAIEIVELADVVSIDDAKPKTNIDSIDEILRRRRHIG